MNTKPDASGLKVAIAGGIAVQRVVAHHLCHVAIGCLQSSRFRFGEHAKCRVEHDLREARSDRFYVVVTENQKIIGVVSSLDFVKRFIGADHA